MNLLYLPGTKSQDCTERQAIRMRCLQWPIGLVKKGESEGSTGGLGGERFKCRKFTEVSWNTYRWLMAEIPAPVDRYSFIPLFNVICRMFIRVLLTSQVVFAGLSNLDASIQQLPGVAAYCERPVASTAKKTLENLVFFFFWLPAEWTNGEWKRIYRLYGIRMMILGSILRKDEASFYNYRKLYYVVFFLVFLLSVVFVYLYIYICCVCVPRYH